MVRRRWLAVGALAAIATAATGWLSREPDFGRVPVRSLQDLERELESLRARLRITGMSAAIGEDNRVVWAQGFGNANNERAIPAGPDTIYDLASLAKPYGATVVLQLVQEARLNLDDPVARFGIVMERSSPVRIRHLLSHTSGEPPGSAYRYDGNAFGALTQIVERTTGRDYAKELADRIIRPLALTHTAPNPSEPREFWSLVASVSVTEDDIAAARADFVASGVDREAINNGLAQGYARAWARWIWPTGLIGPMRPVTRAVRLSTTSGLVASAPDVARFSIALDQGLLLAEETKRNAWSRPLGRDGSPLPYGLGWFVQTTRGREVVWHYGHGLESSSLIVKVPRTGTTFVILANSDGLSRWRGLGDSADVADSPAATLFMNWYLARAQ
ncbi:MAG TPA: serine hydrolase domain-containing protein [Vicinamibacterales bacterium]|nr:serine hydrolase domain-containing protein [Vicinamibacterales bacterium]